MCFPFLPAVQFQVVEFKCRLTLFWKLKIGNIFFSSQEPSLLVQLVHTPKKEKNKIPMVYFLAVIHLCGINIVSGTAALFFQVKRLRISCSCQLQESHSQLPGMPPTAYFMIGTTLSYMVTDIIHISKLDKHSNVNLSSSGL